MEKEPGVDLRSVAGLNTLKPYIEKDHYKKTASLTLSELSGRLTELSGQGGVANLTLACHIVLDAQEKGETTAWITGKESSFYPPDVARGGIDLSALAVIRCPDKRNIPRVADRLARSGAFGLLVLDLGGNGDIPLPLQSHLAGLARIHDMAILFLTEKADDVPSLGSLVSLRGKTWSRRENDDDKSLDCNGKQSFCTHFVCSFKAIKDKRRAPGWVSEGMYHGTPGLC
jgi:recombination protein RecA